MIELSKMIGQGELREVYLHAEDKTLVIKIDMDPRSAVYSLREHSYFSSFIAGRAIATHFPKIFGMVETTRGPGLLEECIRDHDGTISRTLVESLRSGLIDYEAFESALDRLVRLAVRDGIMVRDFSPTNILIRRKDEDGAFDIVIIDGFGPERMNLKTRLRLAFTFLARQHSRKLWKQNLVFLHEKLSQVGGRR